MNSLYTDKRIALFATAAALRLGIFTFFPNIVDLFSNRVEISTPISSFKRLQEGLFLFERGISPYDGGTYHQAPLLLFVFQLFQPELVFIACDLISAFSIWTVAERLSLSTPRFQKLEGLRLASYYLFNPFTIIPCLGQSTTGLTNAAILAAVAAASTGNKYVMLAISAVASHLGFYPILLLPSLFLLDAQARGSKLNITTSAFHLSIYFGVLGILHLAAMSIDGTNSFLFAAYRAQIVVTDLTPNIGLWWYFFIEIFDSFRNFFIGVFWVHLIGYAGALTVRLPQQPVFVIITMIGLTTIFKPYPGLSDLSLYLGVLPLYQHIMPLTRYTFISAAVLLYTTLLGPVFYHLWIYAGSGNANFFYAITLVWALALSMLVGDSLYAVLRDEWEIVRPEMRGKEVRQI